MATAKNTKLLRFIIIGGINTVLDFGIFFALLKFGVNRDIAIIISTSLAFTFSFFMNKKHVFKTTGTNAKREALLFVIVTFFGLWVLQKFVIDIITPLIMHASSLDEPLAALLAKVPATAVSMTWNYLTYDRIVFKHNKEG